MTSLGGWLGCAFVELYRAALGPQLGGACRFHPSCSEYAHQAFSRHGLVAGAGLTLRRIWRCRPGGSAGSDPVP